MFQMEGFTKYIRRGRASTPKVVIRRAGQIGFNSGAIQRYGLDSYEYVLLFISDSKDRVAVKFTNNDKESGLIKIQKRPGSFALSAIPFLQLHGFDYDNTTNYDFLWLEKEKVAIFKPERKQAKI